ncbi:MAG: L-lactate dehydrogenase [Pseudomonadota bacterium]
MIAASIEDYRRAARTRTPHFLFEYVEGGANEEVTLRRNIEGLAGVSLRQRVMRDVRDTELSTELFGNKLSMPIILSPVGLAGMYARRGETLAAQAAAAQGVPFCLSTVSVCPIKEVAAASPAPFWFQLYMVRDRGFVRSMIDAAREAGCTALTVTVDMPLPGYRYRDIRSGLAGAPGLFGQLRRLSQALRRPEWAVNVGLRGKPHTLGNVAPLLGPHAGLGEFFAWVAANFDQSVTWADIEAIRAEWSGPLIIKGLLDPDDALEAARCGADAVAVSNHGGRQLDGALTTVEAVPPVAESVAREGFGNVRIIADGGVRTGTDVLRLLALGAHSVAIGRAWLYGLAADGQRGVEGALKILEAELRVAMALTGLRSISEINRDALA